MGFFGGLVGQGKVVVVVVVIMAYIRRMNAGGGVVGIPMMTSLARLTQHQAHGTSLIAVASTGLAGALAYWHRGGVEEGVDVAAASILAGSASLLARAGALSSELVPPHRLSRYMGAFMLMASFSVAIKAYIDHEQVSASLTGDGGVSKPSLSIPDLKVFTAQLTPTRVATIGAIGVVTGFSAGFLVR